MKELFDAFKFTQEDIKRWYAASDDEEENVKEILVEVIDLLRKNNECQRRILDILAKLDRPKDIIKNS